MELRPGPVRLKDKITPFFLRVNALPSMMFQIHSSHETQAFHQNSCVWPAVWGLSVYAKFTGPFTCYKSCNPSRLSDPDCHSSSMVRKLGLWILETWPVLHSCWVRLRTQATGAKCPKWFGHVNHISFPVAAIPRTIIWFPFHWQGNRCVKGDAFHTGSKASLPTWMLQYKEFHQKL